MLKEGEQYKVVRLLKELLPQAVKPTKSGIRLDCRIYFREKPDGSLWSQVVFVDPTTGKTVNSNPSQSVPLEGDDAIPWYFGEIAHRAFPMAREMRTQPRSDRESA